MTERAELAERPSQKVKQEQRPPQRVDGVHPERSRSTEVVATSIADSVMRARSTDSAPAFPAGGHAPTSRLQRTAATSGGSTTRPDTADGRLQRAPSTTDSDASPSARTRVQRSSAAEAEHAKRMSAEGGNPKSDPPRGRGGEIPEEYEEEDGDAEIDAVADAAIGQVKSKTMNVALGEYRSGQDRVHKKKQSQVAKRSREMAKLKGSVAIAASTVATGAERGGNQAKHGLLNAGRSIGRLLGMKANPSTSVTKQTGTNTTATASGAYGAVDTEFIEPEFTVQLDGNTWHPILTKLNGTYGKIYSPLPGGLSEITGPDPAASHQQIKDLLALDGQDWYITKAVDAHESVHEAHVHDALNNMGSTIAQMFAGLTVDTTAAPTKAEAIAAIKLLPGYNAIMNLANPNASQIRQVWDNEYVNLITGDHDGPTQNAEADVVEPMIDKINSWRKKNKKKKIKKRWTCLNDSNSIQVPKGRKNP